MIGDACTIYEWRNDEISKIEYLFEEVSELEIDIDNLENYNESTLLKYSIITDSSTEEMIEETIENINGDIELLKKNIEEHEREYEMLNHELNTTYRGVKIDF
jgi:predicted RNase H-like nuclease (RuvC/YqgF family)